MKTYVFLGPSLARDEARAILDAEYLEPVAMGDLYALASARARPGDRIAIVDGLFEQVPAVWHKEVLYALEQGMQVYGASSMGALRAAELHGFGMRGVGRIFAAYRDGVIEADDEVAVAHATAEQGFRSLSTAMASIRLALSDMRAAGIVDGAEHDELFHAAQALHYTRRSWAALVGHARARGMRAALVAALLEQARRPDAKAEDAKTLLRLLADEPAGGAAPASSAPLDFRLEQTAFWIGLTRSRAARTASQSGPGTAPQSAADAAIPAFVRAAHPERDSLLRQALTLQLAAAHTASWQPAPADLAGAARRLMRRHGLRTQQALQSWLLGQQLDAAGWRDLLEREARVEACTRGAPAGLDQALLAVLKSEGRYGAVLAQVDALQRQFGDRHKMLTLEDSGVAAEELQAWYEERCGPMLPDPENHARALGFETLRDFVAEILAVYLAERNGHGSASPAGSGTARAA